MCMGDHGGNARNGARCNNIEDVRRQGRVKEYEEAINQQIDVDREKERLIEAMDLYQGMKTMSEEHVNSVQAKIDEITEIKFY